MPPGAKEAIVVASIAGIALAILESMAPQAYLKFIPSAPAMGLGFVIPAWNAISMFAGALAAAVFVWIFPDLARKRLVVIAAGLIVGESLTGVAAALWSIFS